jgi:tetratricopeptide (TPR) repeat protein
MENSRLSQLIHYYQDEPNDPFNVYALAIEYFKTDLTLAKKYFEILLNEHPHYLPTYYHAAKLYQDLSLREMAIGVYERGIELAKTQKEMKALRELQSSYDELMFE